jgi:CheY-like chemotaxis protein
MWRRAPDGGIEVSKETSMNASGLRSVLYVDDEPDIRTIVQIALGLSSDLTVHTGDSGTHAIQLARELHPDVVLLDVMMPGLDGPATLTKMRADPEIAHIPVIFITAKAMPQEVAQFREMGAVGVIAKPFDPMLLGQQLVGMWEDRVPEELPVAAKVANDVPLDATNIHLHVARLGDKFLARSRDEAVILRALSENAHEGDPIVIDEIERMAHKIHGSGAMFGFPAVSARAAEIEQIIEGLKTAEPAVLVKIDASALQRLIECARELANEIETATQE